MTRPISGAEVACQLAEMAADMVAASYRRTHPAATADDVAGQVRQWWLDRPGAPDGDAVGRPRPLGRA